VLPVPPGGGIPAATSSSAGLQPAGALAIYPSVPIDLTASAPSAFIPCAPAVTGKTFITHRVFVQQTVIAGAISIAPTIEIGQTGAVANIFAAANTITNATAFNLGPGTVTQSNALQAAQIASVASGVTVTIAGTGTGGFAFTVIVFLEGFYF
jgi:hypothetical protein